MFWSYKYVHTFFQNWRRNARQIISFGEASTSLSSSSTRSPGTPTNVTFLVSCLVMPEKHTHLDTGENEKGPLRVAEVLRPGHRDLGESRWATTGVRWFIKVIQGDLAIDGLGTLHVQCEGGSDHGADEGPQPVAEMHGLERLTNESRVKS